MPLLNAPGAIIPQPQWQAAAPPTQPPKPGQLQLWQLDLAGSDDNARVLLSADELARWESIRSEPDRRRFALARAGLRLILGGCLQQEPDTLRFGYGPLGKPQLQEEHHRLHFNLSHAADLALVAVTGESPVGVDLEQIQTRPNMRRIARRLFSNKIVAELDRLPDGQLAGAFLHHWTRHEARAKSLGKGVFSTEAQLSSIACQSLIPAAGWIASVATTQRLPDQQEWHCQRLVTFP